jgi:Carboxypeptidase regulatory-like domain/Bacterial Ig-like domain (group 1)/Bacterial Ig domain/Prenyltransferase and squalene oxidase repeat
MRTVKQFLMGVCTLILSSVTVAQAQTSPEVARGLTWLQGQVQTDGTVAGESSSIARSIQVRTETALTLKQLASSMPSMLVIKIQQDSDNATEALSRKTLVSLAGSGDSDSLVTKLLALQNLDGGFGADTGYQSNALDTAWALRALALAGRGNAGAAMAARTFLVSRIGSNGAVAGSSSRQEIIDSAYTLSSLRTQGVDTTNIELLANFLKSVRAADSSWQANDYVTAEVWLALSASVSAAAERSATQSFLKSLQRTDGSWGGDPFITALVLRALTVETTSPVSTQAAISGNVIDSNGAALVGVTVTLSGNSGTTTATTNAQGGFSFAGLAAGLYQLNASRSGYQSAQLSFSLAVGQQLNLAPITLSIVTTSGVVRGVVSKAADNVPLSGVTMTLAGTPSRVTTTDANGVYEFTSVVPGNVSISAAKTGFDTAAGAGTLAAGQTLTFSPALFASGTTPTTPSRVSGKVVSAISGAALEGVSISIDGIEKLKTPASGQFDFELTSGSHRIAFAFAGYTSLTQDFVLQNNVVLSFGTVGLNPIRSSSRLNGRVTQPGGAPLAGTLIEIKGGASTVTAADGTYTIDGVTQTTVNLSASLATYLPQNVNITIPTPRDVTQDFTLQPAATASLAFNAATVAPNPVSANTKVTIVAPLINTGNVGAGTVIVLQIRDSADRVVDRGIPVDATGQPIGRLDLTAGQTCTVRAEWNTGRFAPGTYSLVLRAVTPQSINQSKPDGQLVAETRGTVVINSESVISGTITANPPVLRIGSSSPIKLTAVMRNEGNIALLPQNYRLIATKAGETTSAYNQSVALGAVAVGEIANLAFPDWTPAYSGNYALQLVAEKATGTASSSVYVGDSASAIYTVTPNKTAIGTQTVLGKIAVTGQDAVSGSISDPLAPLIKSAITKAVAFNDTEATAWTLRNNCQGCHIQTQAVVGGEVNERLTAGDRLKRATLINNTSTNLTEYGTYNEGYYRGYPQTLTMLGMWAMANYNERDSHAAAFRRVANYLGSTQTAAGRWEYDYPVGWVATNYASTAINLQSLAEVHRVLKRVGPTGARNIGAAPFGARTANTSRGFVSQDAEGNLYLSTNSGEVIKRDAAGTTLYTWSGLNDPRRALRLSDGRLIVATASGLFQLKADGSTSVLANSPYLYDLVLGKNGKLYSDGFSTNTIYEIDTTSWTVTDWLSGVTDIGLSGPGRIFVEDDGSLLVPNYYGREVVRIKPDKTFSRVTIQTNGQPDDVVRYQNKWWLATTTGLYRYNDKWEGERVLFPPDFAAWGGGQLADLLVLANGDLIAWPANATTLVKIGAVEFDASRFADVGYPYNSGYYLAQDTDGTLYYSVASYGMVKALTSNGVTNGKEWNQGDYSRKVIRLASGELLATTYSGLYRLNSDGTSTRLISDNDLHDIVQTPDGRILVLGYYNGRVYRVDPSNWTVSDWLGGNYPVPLSNPWHMSVEPDGAVLIANYGAKQIVRLKADKTMEVVASNLDFNPTDVVQFQGKWWVSTTSGLLRFNANWALEERVSSGWFVDLLVTRDNRLLAVKDQSSQIFQIGDSASRFQLDLDSIAKTVDRATSYIAAQNNTTSADSFDLAHQLIGLEAARKFYATTDSARADTLYKGMENIGAALRSRQNANGGYGRYWYGQGNGSNSASDSLVTAQVGVALDALNPSARSPEVRKAIEWVLSTQDANGSWFSQNGIFSTREAATTWVAIWLPTMLDRLGGIDTDVSVVFGRNVSMSNARPVPATTETLSTGEVKYVWPMQGVTAAGREIVFDLSLADLQPGETRNASTEAYLTFKNSFTTEDQRAPIDIPAVSASAQVDLGITTDKPAYGANATVSAPVVLTNNNPAAISGTLTIIVRDASGIEVARLSQQPVTIPLQSPLTVSTSWNTGSTVIGRYVVEAELRNPATNQLLAYGKTPFDIITVGPVLASAVSTDKAVYQSREQVVIAGRVFNQSANQYLNNYRVDEKVFAPNNSVIFAASRAIQQIAPGNFVEMRFPWRLNNASPDTYRVEQKVYDDAGALKDTQIATFKVQSSEVTGFGLSGTITAAPKEVRVGETIALTGTVTNSGNSVISNLPLTVRVVDPDKNATVVEYPVTAASIAVSGSFTVPANTWTANVRPNATYLAVLIATVGTGASATQQTLATDTIKVIPQIANTITATAGTPQSAKLSQPYANALEATVRDTAGNPFPGATVTFSAPATGATAAFSGAASGVTDAAGKVRVNVTANATAGAFTVTAATPGVASSATFALTNTALSPPTISFVSPANNTSVNAPGSFALTASVTTPDSTVSKVEFFNGAALLGTGTLTGSNYVYNWTNVVIGEYPNVTAKVTDNKNQTATTSALRLIVAGCGTAAPFAFTPQQNVPLSTAITSNAVPVTGITCPVDVSVTGGEISINNAAFTAAASTVKANDTVRVRVTSSSEYSKAVSALVTIGTIKGSFVVTTLSKADVVQTALNEARILVLVSCPSSSGTTAAGSTAVRDEDDDSTCAKARKVFVDDYLTSLGVEFMTVTNVVDFKRELRCGKYNTYWISGGFAKLKGTLDDELAEAVSRGESLIVDGVHDTRNKLLDEVSGAKYTGVISGNDHQVVLSGAVMPSGTFTSKGRAAKTTFTGATVHGLFDASTSTDTAIASDAYGLGKALTFAFDWVATAQQAASAVTAKEAMKRGISLIAPAAPTDLTPNEYVRFKTSIANPASTAGTFEIAATLPPAAVFASSVPAPTSITGNVAKWRITAPASGSAEVVYSFRTPTQDSAQPVATTVSSVVDTTLTEIAAKSTPLAVVGYVTRSAAVKTQIDALNPTPAAEKQARDKAVTYLTDATTKRSANSLQDAIESLLKVQGELDKVTSLNTQTVQVQVGLLIKTVEREFCLSGQTESYCTATASFVSNGAFTDVDSNDGNIKLIRVRGGGPGSPTTGTLGGVWRVGSFIKQGATEVKSVDNFVAYTSGKVYNWTFEYKGNGKTIFTLVDPARPATIVTQNDRWIVKNALKFSVHVDAGIGSAFKIESNILTLNGAPLTDGKIVTNSNNLVSDISKVLAGPSLKQPFIVTGTVILTFPPPAVVPGDKLYFQINGGEAPCADDEEK